MTLPPMFQTAKSSPLARLWLALLLAMLIALLPGPQVIAPASLTAYLGKPAATLSATQGRDFVSRKDAADTRLLVMAGPRPSQALPSFLRAKGTLCPALYSCRVPLPHAQPFRARGPPSFA